MFTDKGHTQLVQYDVGKKAKRVVAEDAKVKCAWPAVSPDGTRFAMATQTATYTAGSPEVVRTTALVLLDRDGAEVQKAKAFEFTETSETPAAASETTVWPGFVCWRGHKDRLVLAVFASGTVDTAIYDRTKDKWVRVSGVPLAAPTERGYLTVRESAPKGGGKGREVLSVVD